MTRVTVRLDRNLENLVRPPRQGPLDISAPTGASVLEDLGFPHTEIRAFTADGRAVAPGFHPSEGSRIDATGVDSEPSDHPPTFLLDVHLGRLARLLRLLGFDAAWSRDASDAELAATSANEGRILVSRDRGLLKRREVRQGCLARSPSPREQIEQVVERYGLRRLLSPFTRCLVCNAQLEHAEPGDAGDAPRATGRCPGCGRRCWRGSPWDAMERLVEEIRRGNQTPAAVSDNARALPAGAHGGSGRINGRNPFIPLSRSAS
jgi:uncharacterized protein with PIN domain